MENFPKIVGIGASAGGLKSISEFFDHISPDTGMAYVVVQHLSQDFKSMMDELLQRHTKMPIHIVDKPTIVEANNIYLISSQFNIILKKNYLNPIKRSDPVSINLPIDLFFHSLGKQLKDKAVGIVLSGTGSDGSKGLLTIQKEGGVVMVEDPQHAQFDGMPLAAMSSTTIDFVLPPYALAREMMRIHNGGKKNSNFLIIDTSVKNFRPLFEDIIGHVRIKTGMNFKNYRDSTLIRRMEKRMFITKQHSLESYMHYLKRDDKEVNTLQDEFLINVTHFFRDKEAFNLLKTDVLPALCKGKMPKEQIRVWIVACSTGQEALSIAILFKEYILENKLDLSVKIFASDIDKKAVTKASEAIYSAALFNEMPTHYLKKYFEPTDAESSHFSVKKSLRECIVYAKHDALYDPPFINLDLVSCRNMMIYHNLKNQKILIGNFHFALNYGGYLFLGPSETIGTLKKLFKPVSTKWNIFKNIGKQKSLQLNAYTEIGDPQISEKNEKNLQWRNAFPVNSTITPSKKSTIQDKLFQKLLIEQFAPTCILINQDLDVLFTNGEVEKLLSFPRVSGNFNLSEMVPSEVLIIFKNGVRKCLESNTVNRYQQIPFSKGKSQFNITIQFSPFNSNPHQQNEDVILVEFFQVDENPKEPNKEIITEEKFKIEKINTIEKELQKIQHEKQLLVEQLEMANEELQSSNEELLAANEELQSTNEELQSVNEELYTVNTELQNKVNQLITTTNDLDNLLNSTEIGSIFLDRELNIRRFTPAITEQFDLLEGDVGRPIMSFTNSTLNKDIYKEIKNVVSQLVVFEKEVTDDRNNHYLLRVLPYRTDAGQVDGAVLTFIPINEIKKAHYKLEEVGKTYQAVFDNSSDSILLIDKQNKVTSSNVGFGNLTKEEIIGVSMLSIMPRPYEEILKASIQQVMDGEPSSYFHFENVDQDNETHWFLASVTPVIIQDDIRCLAIIMRDVTEVKLKELELREMGVSLEKQVLARSEELAVRNTELREINSYLDSFVHGAAHDLRAPITQIQGMMALYPKLRKEKQKENVFGEMRSCINRLEKTLNGLIEMIDFQKNNNRVAQNIHIYDVTSEVLDQMNKELNEIDAEVIMEIPKDISVHYVRAYVTSIFYNLLSNAIKYRSYDRKLKINISVKQNESYTVINIGDNGIGIDLNRYGHFLFQPFKRLTLEREGTGIGLSIINNVVKKSGGKIEVDSKLQKGTTFTVYLSNKIKNYEAGSTEEENSIYR